LDKLKVLNFEEARDADMLDSTRFSASDTVDRVSWSAGSSPVWMSVD